MFAVVQWLYHSQLFHLFCYGIFSIAFHRYYFDLEFKRHFFDIEFYRIEKFASEMYINAHICRIFSLSAIWDITVYQLKLINLHIEHAFIYAIDYRSKGKNKRKSKQYLLRKFVFRLKTVGPKLQRWSKSKKKRYWKTTWESLRDRQLGS